MGDEHTPYSLANAVLQATAALNRATHVNERQQDTLERLARGVEEGNAQHLTFSARTTTAIESLAAASQEQSKQIAVLASALQALTPQVAEAKSEASRAANNTGSMRLPDPNAPKHVRPEDSAKTPASVARKAWHDLLYAPGRGQLVAVAVLFLAALTFLGYLTIKNKNIRASEFEHDGAPILHHHSDAETGKGP